MKYLIFNDVDLEPIMRETTLEDVLIFIQKQSGNRAKLSSETLTTATYRWTEGECPKVLLVAALDSNKGLIVKNNSWNKDGLYTGYITAIPTKTKKDAEDLIRVMSTKFSSENGKLIQYYID